MFVCVCVCARPSPVTHPQGSITMIIACVCEEERCKVLVKMTAAPQSCCFLHFNVFFLVVMFTYVTDPSPGSWLLEKTEHVMGMLM